MTKGKFGRFFLPWGRVSSAACLMPMKRVVIVWKQCEDKPYLSATLWKYLNGSCFDFRAMDPFVDSSDCTVSSLQNTSFTNADSTRPHVVHAHSNCIHIISLPHSSHFMPAPSRIAKCQDDRWRCAQCLLVPGRVNIFIDQVGYSDRARYSRGPAAKYIKLKDKWHTYLIGKKQFLIPSQVHVGLLPWDVLWVPDATYDDDVPIGCLSTTQLKSFRRAVNRHVPDSVYNLASKA